MKSRLWGGHCRKLWKNPTLWGWIGNLMVNVQNTECKLKLIYPAVRHLDPGELPARSHDTSPEKGYKADSVFPFVWGPPNLQGAEHLSWGAKQPWGCKSWCFTAGLAQNLWMFISEEMLSSLQETDILFSNPFLLVKTAFVNDFCWKVNVCTDNVNFLEKIKLPKKKEKVFCIWK